MLAGVLVVGGVGAKGFDEPEEVVGEEVFAEAFTTRAPVASAFPVMLEIVTLYEPFLSGVVVIAHVPPATVAGALA